MTGREVRVARHDDGAVRWEMAHAAPAPALRPGLNRYCGFRERSAAPMRRREVPAAEVALIVGLGSTIDVFDTDRPGAPGRRLGSFVAALHDTASLTQYEGEQHGVEVGLHPLGARAVFGKPMHELTNEVVELHELWGRDGELLAERLHGVPTWEARFEVLDGFFAARLANAPERRGPRGDRDRLRLLRPGPPEPRLPPVRRHHAGRVRRPGAAGERRCRGLTISSKTRTRPRVSLRP